MNKVFEIDLELRKDKSILRCYSQYCFSYLGWDLKISKSCQNLCISLCSFLFLPIGRTLPVTNVTILTNPTIEQMII